jgi:hypothetical protein
MGLRNMLVVGTAAMTLLAGFAPAASAHPRHHHHRHHHGRVARGGDGGDGGIGVGIGVCAIIASCDDVGSNNGSGGDGGDAKIRD